MSALKLKNINRLFYLTSKQILHFCFCGQFTADFHAHDEPIIRHVVAASDKIDSAGGRHKIKNQWHIKTTYMSRAIMLKLNAI